MKILFLFVLVALCIISINGAFAQQMGFYENKLYDFSFEVPTGWSYQESVTAQGLTFPVMLFPNEFSLKNANDPNFLDLSTAMSGFTFQIEAPLISVQFKNIPSSEVSNLNDNSIKDYVEKELKIMIPDIKIYSLSVESRSWGWIVKDDTAQSIDIGLGQGMPYHAKDTYYVFKDREMYTIGYGTVPKYFDSYTDVYAHALDTLTIKGIQVSKPEPLPVSLPTDSSGGCLIATATYDSELSTQVQQLRELRDNVLLKTKSGATFMAGFNEFYYSFSPTIADWERESPILKEIVKITLTPMISSLSILNYVDMDSEASVLGYGISLIILNAGMYFVAPGIVIHTIRKKF